MKQPQMLTIAVLIDKVLNGMNEEGLIGEVRHDVEALVEQFPLYLELRRLLV